MPAVFHGNHLHQLFKQYAYAVSCQHRNDYQLSICCIYNEDRFNLLASLFPSELYPSQFSSELYARVVIIQNDQPFVRMYYQDGKNRICTFEQLNDYLLAKDTLLDFSDEHPLQTVCLGLPIPNLPAKLHLVLPPPLTASARDAVFTNDLLSSDLSVLCIPPMLALPGSDGKMPLKRNDSWQLKKLFSILRKQSYQNYLLVVPDADNKRKAEIRNALFPFVPQPPLFDDNPYILSGGLLKSDKRALDRIIQEMNSRTDAFFSRARVYRLHLLLNKMALCNEALITRKKQAEELLNRTNLARTTRIHTAQRLSRDFYASFQSELELFNIKKKGLFYLENRCRNKLYSHIRIHDPHLVRVEVYSLLHQEITAYLQALGRILCAQKGYSDLKKALSGIKWDLGNIFSSLQVVEFHAQKNSFSKRGNSFRRTMIHLLTEDILRVLMSNLQKEQQRFLKTLKKALDDYSSRFSNNIPLIDLREIKKSIGDLEQQQRKLVEYLDTANYVKR